MSAADGTETALRRVLDDYAAASDRHRARVARALDLRGSELAALTHLAERGPLAPRELRDLLGLSSGGVTMLVQRLERRGHLARRAHPVDRRSLVVELTAPSAARLAAYGQPLAVELDAALAGLDSADAARLRGLLAELVAIIDRHADGPVEVQPPPAALAR
jgi:DNA-binding MarR family transcriptional regulator